jgi:2-polyprenyl-6-methoxyphenol hydroxylase-like FAD-dependent oxidoreductase
MIRDILIIGSGITGLSAALSLSDRLSPLIPDLRITIFERHFVPSTSGGAIGLSPVAFRHLDHLGVLDELARFGPDAGADVDAIEIFSARTGKSLGQVDYGGKQGTGFSADITHHGVSGETIQNHGEKKYKGGRVLRINLSLAMLAAIEKRANIKIVFGKALSKVTPLDPVNKVELLFKDKSTATGDLLLGCDGVHSATRRKFIDPGREAEYSRFSLVQSTIRTDSLKTSPHFRATSLNFSKSGTLLMTFCNKHHEDIFLSVMLECCEEAVKGHTVHDDDDETKRSMIKDALSQEVSLRYGQSSIPCIKEVAANTDIDWMLYPIYQVPLGGKWSTERAILLGDAAHAVCLDI